MECLICHKKFKALTNTHLFYRHNITPKEYENRFGRKTVPEGWVKKEKNPFYGKQHIEGKSKAKSREYREAARDRRKGKKPEEFLVNVSPEDYHKCLSESLKGTKNAMYGRTHSEEYKKKLSERFSGEGNPNWRGGIAEFQYPLEFRKSGKDIRKKVRMRENNRCFICGIPEKQLKRKLDVHHIDYDKSNCGLNNLMALCHDCHMKASYDRELWRNCLSILLYFRYGNQKRSLGSNLLERSETNARLLADNAVESNGNTSAQHPLGMMI